MKQNRKKKIYKMQGKKKRDVRVPERVANRALEDRVGVRVAGLDNGNGRGLLNNGLKDLF